jgi:hypothetical protein
LICLQCLKAALPQKLGANGHLCGATDRRRRWSQRHSIRNAVFMARFEGAASPLMSGRRLTKAFGETRDDGYLSGGVPSINAE